jgi:hypothetical protein
MPSILPRLTVVLAPEQHQLLTRLAALQGRSAASYVRHLVEIASPSFRSLLVKLDAVQEHEGAVDENLAAAIDHLVSEAEDQVEDQLDLLSFIDGVEPDFEDRMGAARAATDDHEKPTLPPYSNTGVSYDHTGNKPVFKAISGGRKDAR